MPGRRSRCSAPDIPTGCMAEAAHQLRPGRRGAVSVLGPAAVGENRSVSRPGSHPRARGRTAGRIKVWFPERSAPDPEFVPPVTISLSLWLLYRAQNTIYQG